MLWRRGGPFVSGLKETLLNVRFVMPNGNYDYIVTYQARPSHLHTSTPPHLHTSSPPHLHTSTPPHLQFALDGRMRVNLGSSGYIQSHFWSTDRGGHDSMAYKVHTYTGASLHDHTFAFKVDLDINTEQNSFEVIEYKMADTLTAVNAQREVPYTEKPPYLLFPKMRYAEINTIANEDDARMNINPEKPTTWTFGDKTQKNKWGNMRGYKLAIDQNPSPVVDPDHHTMPAFSFAKQMLAVTQYKETEADATGHYDLNRLDDPQGPFDRMVDGENIEQTDIVAWVTMTAMHLPTSEDYPMTNVIHHGFTLSPHNFFDECVPSLLASTSIIVDRPKWTVFPHHLPQLLHRNGAMDLPHYLRMQDPADTRTMDHPKVAPCEPIKYDTTHTFAGV